MTTDEEWAAINKFGEAILDLAGLVVMSKLPFTKEQKVVLRSAIMEVDGLLERYVDPLREPEHRGKREAR